MVLKFHGLDKQARYEAVASRLPSGTTILDVGGGVGDFMEFASCAGVVADLPTDQSLFGAAPLTHPFVSVRGPLPFRDKCFGSVVSLDTLEHVPRQGRSEFVRELLRVARDRVILTFPARQYYPTLLLAIARFYEAIGFGSTMRTSLEEHVRNGLPTTDEVCSAICPDEWAVEVETFFGAGATLLWVAQFFLPFLATPPFNSAMSAVIRRRSGMSGGEVLLSITRSAGSPAPTTHPSQSGTAGVLSR